MYFRQQILLKVYCFKSAEYAVLYVAGNDVNTTMRRKAKIISQINKIIRRFSKLLRLIIFAKRRAVKI